RHQRPGIATPYAAPRNSLEERLAELWEELLGIAPVGIHDDFIELGGHSLLGIQLYSRLQQAFGVTVPLAVLFETQTIVAMAAVIAEGEELQPLEAPVVPVPRDRPLPRRGTNGGLPLSFGQERLWFLAQLEPENPAYNIPQAFRFRGPVEVAALEGGLEEIVRRHETLRTTFEEGPEGPVQIIASPAPLALAVVDLTVAGGEQEAVRLLWRESGRPFDLAREWMIRACVLRLAAREHLLLVTVHHIVFDNWSQIVLHRELAEVYRALTSGRKPRLPALEVQYADFAAWQREQLRDQALERQIAYWTERLGSPPPAPALPTDRPRPPVETFAGKRLQVRVEPGLTARLETLGRKRGTTPFMTVLAIFQTLVHRLTGQDDLTTGTPVGGRTRPEVQDLIGIFINNLVLRTDLGGDPPFAELLDRVREVALGAFAHQDLPFEKLVEVLRPQRDLSRAPLFQVLFALQTLPAPSDIVAPEGVELTPLPLDPGSAIYDLTLNLEEDLSGWLEYNTDLFDASTAARLLKHFQCLAQGVVEAPATPLSALPLIAAPERHQLLAECNDTGARFPGERPIHELIAAQAERTPEAVAVVCEDRTVSYGELARRSELLAGWLARNGVGPESLVGIALEPGPELVVALLAVLGAGGAYLPLDPSYPEDRLAYVLEDSGAGALITREHLRPLLPELAGPVLYLDEGWPAESRDEPSPGPARVGPESLAYVIYTSGSTGRPKGVEIPHRALVNFLASMRQRPGLGPRYRLLAVTPLSFDISGLELYLPLLA
ncbi:MAG: AMP-binding protein, partial [bacterium]|nr:AMP-binding protein [bacterium]